MTNSTGITTFPENEVRSIAVIAILAIIIIIFIFLSVFGNILVIVAVLTTHSLREEKSNYLVINLAVTDMLNGSTVMLSTLIALVMDLHTVPYVLCNLMCAVNYCLIIASMMTLCFISIDRFVAFIFPLRYTQRVTGKIIAVAIVLAWLQGIIFSIVPIIQDWIQYDYWEVTCAIQWHKEGDKAIYYVIAAFIFCFLLPGLVLAFNYIKILRAARKKMKIWSVNLHTKNRDERKQIKKESTSAKTVRSLLIVVFTYFICMTPFSVTKLIKVSSEEVIIPGYVNTTASMFEFISSVVNPLIYGIFRRDFRKAFKNIIRKRLTEKSVERSNRIYPSSSIGMDTDSI